MFGIDRGLRTPPRIAGGAKRRQDTGGQRFTEGRRRKLLEPTAQCAQVLRGTHQRAAAVAERFGARPHDLEGDRGRRGITRMLERRGEGRGVDGAVGDGGLELGTSRGGIAGGDQQARNAGSYAGRRRGRPAGHGHRRDRLDRQRLAPRGIAPERTQQPFGEDGPFRLAPRGIVHEDRERHARAGGVPAHQLGVGRERDGTGIGYQRDAAGQHDERHVGAAAAKRRLARLERKLCLRTRCGIDPAAAGGRCIAAKGTHRDLDTRLVEAEPEQAAGKRAADGGPAGIRDRRESVRGEVRPCPSEECRCALCLPSLERVDPERDERLHAVRVERQHRLPVGARPGSISCGTRDLGTGGPQFWRCWVKAQRRIDVVHGAVQLTVEEPLLAANIATQRFGFGGTAGKRRWGRRRRHLRGLPELPNRGGKRNRRTTQRRDARHGHAGGRLGCGDR